MVKARHPGKIPIKRGEIRNSSIRRSGGFRWIAWSKLNKDDSHGFGTIGIGDDCGMRRTVSLNHVWRDMFGVAGLGVGVELGMEMGNGGGYLSQCNQYGEGGSYVPSCHNAMYVNS